MTKQHDAADCGETVRRTFTGMDFSGADLSSREYVSCAFDGGNFSQADCTGASFDACVFRGCNVSNPKLTNSRFLDCSFTSCKLLGMNFCDCDQLSFDLAIDDSRLSTCNFSGLKMKRSSFKSCVMEDCYFEDTFLVESDFTGTVFRSTLFHQCDLQKAVFTDAEGYAINPLTNKIRKAVFGLPGALSLLDYFDIVLK